MVMASHWKLWRNVVYNPICQSVAYKSHRFMCCDNIQYLCACMRAFQFWYAKWKDYGVSLHYSQAPQVSKSDSMSTVKVYRKLYMWITVNWVRPLQVVCPQGNRQPSFQGNQLSLDLHRLLKTVINHKVSVSLLPAVTMETEIEN